MPQHQQHIQPFNHSSLGPSMPCSSNESSSNAARHRLRSSTLWLQDSKVLPQNIPYFSLHFTQLQRAATISLLAPPVTCCTAKALDAFQSQMSHEIKAETIHSLQLRWNQARRPGRPESSDTYHKNWFRTRIFQLLHSRQTGEFLQQVLRQLLSFFKWSSGSYLVATVYNHGR